MINVKQTYLQKPIDSVAGDAYSSSQAATHQRTTEQGEMNTDSKPRRVRARITRTVIELAIVTLDKHGCVDEFIETLDEIETAEIDLRSVDSVISYHD